MNLPYVSIVIPTRNRAKRLRQTLRSIGPQLDGRAEVLIIDGSDDTAEISFLAADFAAELPRFLFVRADRLGAAQQRNQGVALAQGTVIGFCDDDLDFEPNCLRLLRDHLDQYPDCGGVSATIVNQAPRRFGFATRAVTGLMDRRRGQPLDGRIVGPALNFLPASRPDAPAVCHAEWLNTTCTLYRRAALPTPPFDAHFQGYSMLEDVCLSWRVGQRMNLAVLRDARVFHDSQPGDHKRSAGAVARMGLQNRFFVATRVLGRPPLTTWSQLALWQAFMAAAGLRRIGSGWLQQNCGALAALAAIAAGRK